MTRKNSPSQQQRASDQPGMDYIQIPFGGPRHSLVRFTQLLVAIAGGAEAEPNIRGPDLEPVLGNAKFYTLGQIAEAFRVHTGTVRADWRSQGLPGDPDNGYPAIGVLLWYFWRGRGKGRWYL